MALLYKVFYRNPGDVQFKETPEWLSCDECIARMRSLLSADPGREFQIVDDHRVVVVSTLANGRHGTTVTDGRLGVKRAPGGNTEPLVTRMASSEA